MFSDIQNIHSASEPLKTEAVDSRLGNRKRDDENQRSKLSNDENVEEDKVSLNEEGEPTTEINKKESVNRFSLDSLIYFLEDFLEEHLVLQTTQSNEAPDNLGLESKDSIKEISTVAPWLRSRHVNSNSKNNPASGLSSQKRNMVPPRYAAHAYAHRALSNNISRHTQQKVKQHGAYEQKNAPLPHNSLSNDVGDIYDLISDLRVMKERGTTHLDVKDNAALLEGISAAIRKNAVL